MFAKRAHVMERMDRWREVLLHEPRGYPCSNVDYLVEPTLAGADAGFVIAEQAKIYPLMSGHNTICVATALVECGALPEDRRASFLLEAPGGPIPIAADVAADGRCERVTFGGTPSFVGKRDAVVRLDAAACAALALPATEVRVDVAYGGMWYVIVDAADLGLTLEPAEGARLRAVGELADAGAANGRFDAASRARARSGNRVRGRSERRSLVQGSAETSGRGREDVRTLAPRR
jgi:proline racemase